MVLEFRYFLHAFNKKPIPAAAKALLGCEGAVIQTTPSPYGQTSAAHIKMPRRRAFHNRSAANPRPVMRHSLCTVCGTLILDCIRAAVRQTAPSNIFDTLDTRTCRNTCPWRSASKSNGNRRVRAGSAGASTPMPM